MRALTHDPDAAGGLSLREVDDPTPRADQVVLAVEATALNFLDVAYRHERLERGMVPGVEAAGVVLQAAADGSGPAVGTRVSAFTGPGAWAEQVAVATADVAAVPETVPLESAAALPAAGVTALQAVRALGPVVGRRVLVTGASGGVGRYAVQVAALAGAEVVALVGSEVRARGLVELGASVAVTSLDAVDDVDGVVELVGGDVMTASFARLTRGGRLLSVGRSSGVEATIDYEAERVRGGGRWISPFVLQGPFGPDLSTLLDLVASQRLAVPIGWDGSWLDVEQAVEALSTRQVNGKAVLRIAASLARPGLTTAPDGPARRRQAPPTRSSRAGRSRSCGRSPSWGRRGRGRRTGRRGRARPGPRAGTSCRPDLSRGASTTAGPCRSRTAG